MDRTGILFVAGVLLVGSHARLVEIHQDRSRSLLESRTEAYCDEPVAKAPVTFPEDLVGRAGNLSFDMFSGYVNVTSEDWLFYW